MSLNQFPRRSFVGSSTIQTLTGNGTQTVFTLSSAQTQNECFIFVDDVVQVPSVDFTVNGTVLTFTSAPANTAEIIVRGFGVPAPITTVSDGSITTAKLATGAIEAKLGYTPASAATVASQLATLVDSAPTTLDTLNELAAALGDDANFATTITTALGTKANSSSLGPLATLTPTGTASSSTFLAGDGSYKTVSVTPTAVSDQSNTATGYFDLPAGTTAERPSSPTSGNIRFNTTTAVTEFYNGSAWVGIGLKDGSTSSTAAPSAAAIKALNANVQSGVYWLQVTGVNNSLPFQCYCDFVINGGIGYAMIINQYFVGSEEGPSFTTMAAGNSGSAGYNSEYTISPNAMLANYGLTKLAVFARADNGSSSGGIQSASPYRWVTFSGVSSSQYNTIFNNRFDTIQFTGSFVTSDGNTGTAYFPNTHGGTGGVTQISSSNSTTNNYILYEYKPQGGSDPNHFWMVANGRDGDTYFGANSLYQGTLNSRWGGVLIY